MATKATKPRFTFDPHDDPQVVIDSYQAYASRFQVEKHKREARRNWDVFYKSHPNPPGEGLAFFKDRHWTTREFEVLGRLKRADEMTAEKSKDKGRADVLEDAIVLEVGCGTGAFVYPLMEESPSTRFHAFDFSKRAVDQVKLHPKFSSSRVHAFEHDLTLPNGSSSLFDALASAPPEFWLSPRDASVPPLPSTSQLPDVVSCIFVLSALPPSAQAGAVKELFSVLKPGGTLILRDYALHDQTQLRFHALPSKNWATVPSLLSPPLSALEAADNEEAGRPWYRRGDSTMCYFFTVEEIDTLVKGAAGKGWKMEGGAELLEREMENRKEGWGCTRRFVQGAWTKVVASVTS